jgi:hypothetical protein
MEIEKILDILDNEVIPINDKDNELTAKKINNIYQSQLKAKDEEIEWLKKGEKVLSKNVIEEREENTKLKDVVKYWKELAESYVN